MKHIKRFNESNVNESFKTKAKKLIDDTKKLKDDYPEKKYTFEGDLTAENIYKYYLEQTGDEDKAKELVDKLISKFDELIEKGEK